MTSIESKKKAKPKMVNEQAMILSDIFRILGEESDLD